MVNCSYLRTQLSVNLKAYPYNDDPQETEDTLISMKDLEALEKKKGLKKDDDDALNVELSSSVDTSED